MNLIKKLIFLSLVSLIISCINEQKFVHDISEGPQPWINSTFNDSGEFTFAIISDLNGGEREGIFEIAVRQLNLLRPEFILSVGDLIDGGTEDRAQLANEWNDFDNRASGAKAPFFHLGGNHDLTNVVMRDVWEERYGPRYYHFVYKDVLFLMMDSEDFEEERMQEIYLARAEALSILDGPNPEAYKNSEYFHMEERVTGAIGNEQTEYFIEVLNRYPNVKWTFVLMHKPVWRNEKAMNFQMIEEQLSDRPYTLINGHLHAYDHQTRMGRDYITLGTTGGGQNPNNENSFDHITLVTITDQGPVMANLKMEGILDLTATIPGARESTCFQASRCL